MIFPAHAVVFPAHLLLTPASILACLQVFKQGLERRAADALTRHQPPSMIQKRGDTPHTTALFSEQEHVIPEHKKPGSETTLCCHEFTSVLSIPLLLVRCCGFIAKLYCVVMPGRQPSVVPPTDAAALVPIMPPTLDRVIRWALRTLQLDGRGHAGTCLSTELTEMIVGLTHKQEHRDRTALVFSEMKALPKCQACGSVSKTTFFL